MMQISSPAAVPAPVPNRREPPAPLPSGKWQSRQSRYESEAARSLLRHNGLDDVDGLFALASRCLHHHKGRAVSRITLHQPEGGAVEAFVKLNWGRRRLIPRMTDVKSGQAFQNLPEREWRGIEALRSLGLFVPERLALYQRGWFWFREAVIIKRVPPKHSLDDMIRNGEWDQLPPESQRTLLETVVGIMQRIHQAGLGWRGTCTRHFFPKHGPNGIWQCWLIDCEGVHRRVTERAIARDYRKLYRAFEISGANSGALHQFQLLSETAQASNPRGKSPSLLQWLSLRLDPTLKPSA